MCVCVCVCTRVCVGVGGRFVDTQVAPVSFTKALTALTPFFPSPPTTVA